MAAQSASTLQDMFLAHLRDQRAEMTMFLMNGIRLQGQIKRFDNFTVQLVRGTAFNLSISMRSRRLIQWKPSECSIPMSNGNPAKGATVPASCATL